MTKHTRRGRSPQGSGGVSRLLEATVYGCLAPFLKVLKRQLDRRLVQTCLGLVLGILMHRHRNHGLLLSELGSYLLSPDQAVAGTKRLSRLLHSPKWEAGLIDEFVAEGADDRVQRLAAQGEWARALWDESVVEKAESLKPEGLCPVRSAKAARLKRIKPGFYNPPGGRPIFVPGFHWLQAALAVVLGLSGPPTLAAMRWWTTRGQHATDRRSVEQALLAEVSRTWGAQVVHVWDRGFAGNPWLTAAFVCAARFILRWPKRYHLTDEQGDIRPAWQLGRGKRSWEHRLLYDTHRRCQRKVGILAFPVQDQIHQQDLWLVIARRGQGQEPWYLLTTEPIRSPADAWRIVFAYARRWQIELAFRFFKTELALESPRVYAWPVRAKLIGIVTLAYHVLLTLLEALFDPLRQWLLDRWCARNDQRSRKVAAPLYRLRSAISRLWLAHPPPLLLRLNSG